MPLIHADGLFDGDRINSCSIQAQLYYPRLMCSANGFGRINLAYSQLVARAFPRWPNEAIPDETILLGYVQEYVDNRLLYAYRSGGQIWGQWDARKGTFGKYQTSDDKRSPCPPEPEFSQWLDDNRKNSTKVSEPCRKISAKLPNGSEQNGHGVGVGVGIGDGVTCKVLREKSSPRPARRAQKDSPPYGRHERFHQMIMAWYLEWAELECPWGPGEGAQLKSLLGAWPKASEDQFKACLEHLALSDCIPKGDRPQAWLAKLPKFVTSPLDEFWKPKRRPVASGPCSKHPDSGRTATGGCWQCVNGRQVAN